MATNPDLTLALTTGEPAGIGPDITIAALVSAPLRTRLREARARCVVFGDTDLLTARADAIGAAVAWRETLASGLVAQRAFALPTPVRAGRIDPAHAVSVLAMLDAATDGCLAGDYAAMVTAPVNKHAIASHLPGFQGHTEYLAERTGTARVVMMLAGARPDGVMLRVALATTHLPLRAVPDAINTADLVASLRIIDHDLRARFGIAKPVVLVTGLNPHAGEQDLLGDEETRIIAPAIALAREQGIDARGPFPADTLFQPRHLDAGDCVLAMYHDQGLAPLKFASFGRGVNITLGLPVIRTSVDHGTALDLAGTGQADAGSMREAIAVALHMAEASRA